jgi:glycosyltransferase involved in cell wall biosynthesis
MGAGESRAVAVSVIVPARNARADLHALVRALERQTLPRRKFEVLIADDGSDDNGAADLEDEHGWIRVLPGPPLNSYAARNRAVAAATAPILAFCDADCRPEPLWLEKGVSAVEEADLAAGRIRFALPERRTVWTLLDMDSFKDHSRQVEQGTAETANLFVRRTVYDSCGGFDDSLPEHGDFDFVQRCLAAGVRLVYAPDAIVWHPTRDRGRPFLRAVWIYNRWYAAREARAGRLPEGLKLRSWVPVVQRVRARRRWGQSLDGPDRRWLAANDVRARPRERLTALPLMYLVVPYLSGVAQLVGWRDGKRLR